MQTARAELPCRLIVDPPAAGTWNMAVDEALLADAAEHGVATLRLYQWNEPTLSLGYFQQYEDRQHHAASQHAAVVRRQSGGGAILHDRELTYSLALPASHQLARHAQHLYMAVHQAFLAVLAPRIAAAAPGWTVQLRGDDSELPPRAEPFLCFQRRACGDVLLRAPDTDAHQQRSWKILGSAQRRRRGAILQHGSLVLVKSIAAPEIDGLHDLTGIGLSADGLAAVFPAELGTALSIHIQESSLSEALEPMIAELESRKFAVPAWTKRR